MTNIISYLPTVQRVKSCMFVSTIWREIINDYTFPLTMRIEDRNKKQIRHHDPMLNVTDKGVNYDIHCPLHNIEFLPMSVRGKVTKLTVVLKFVKKYTNRYKLNSILNLFEGFSKLEDLTIISDSTKIVEHIILCQGHILPSLKKFKSDKFSFDYKRLVSFAPNLEHLDVQHLEYDDLDDLLPLSGSLQNIQVTVLVCWKGYFEEYDDDDDDDINCLIDRFIDKMASLTSFQFTHCWRQVPQRHPVRMGFFISRMWIQKLVLSNSIAEWKALNIHEWFGFERRNDGIDDEFVLLNIITRWFLELKEKDKGKDRTRAVSIIRQFSSMLERTGRKLGNNAFLLQNIHKLLRVTNIGKKNVRRVILKEVKQVNKCNRLALYTEDYDLHSDFYNNIRWCRGIIRHKVTWKRPKLPNFRQQNANTFKIEVGPSERMIRNYDIN